MGQNERRETATRKICSMPVCACVSICVCMRAWVCMGVCASTGETRESTWVCSPRSLTNVITRYRFGLQCFEKWYLLQHIHSNASDVLIYLSSNLSTPYRRATIEVVKPSAQTSGSFWNHSRCDTQLCCQSFIKIWFSRNLYVEVTRLLNHVHRSRYVV